MRRTTRRLQVEALEEKTLLSAAAHRMNLRAAALHRPAQVAAQQTSLPTDQIQALQQTSSGGTLEQLISQLAAVVSNRQDVQQYATQVLTDHQYGDLNLMMLAQAQHVLLPDNLTPSEQQTAQQVIAAIGGQNFDQVYLSTMQQVNSNDIQTLQTLVNSSDSTVQQFAQSQQQTDTTHRDLATMLLNNQNVNLPSPPSATAGSLSSGEFSYLQQSYSTSSLERLLSGVATVVSPNTQVQNYGMYLVHDHSLANMMILQSALSAGAIIPAGLQPTDAGIARNVLTQNLSNGNQQGGGTSSLGSYDTAYLNTMLMTHTQNLMASQQIQGSAQNPNVRVFAMSSVPMDYVHYNAASQILNGGNGGNNGGVGTFPGFAAAGATNVRVSYSHPGNGTLNYRVTFDSGAYRFTQRYSLNINRIRNGNNRNGGGPGLTGVEAVNLFLQSLYARLNNPNSLTGGVQQTRRTTRARG